MPCIAHLVSLQGSAGVEAHFAEFIRSAESLQPQWHHIWLNPAGKIHPIVSASLGNSLQSAHDVKRIGPIRLPSVPRNLRAAHTRRLCNRGGAKTGVVWNRTARSEFFLDALGDENVIHWEHGRAWHAGRETERQRYLDRIKLIIANSNAAKRVLQLRWGYTGKINVCRNALRPSLVPAEPRAKQYPSGRPIRLGTVARLLPVKGVPLAIRALDLLTNASFNAELHIAGEGPERSRLQDLVVKLGLGTRVRFHGVVSDMASFYSNIDCLIHLPLTEAFGLVGLEAAVYGCPVIAAAVDGLTESVRDGVSGRCLRPSLPLSEYERFGSSTLDVPPQVYDPFEDRMQSPQLVDPRSVADALQELFADPNSFERTSRSGAERVSQEFKFDDHVNAVFQAIESFSQR